MTQRLPETFLGKTVFMYLCTCRSAKSGSNFLHDKIQFSATSSQSSRTKLYWEVWNLLLCQGGFLCNFIACFNLPHSNKPKHPRNIRRHRQEGGKEGGRKKNLPSNMSQVQAPRDKQPSKIILSEGGWETRVDSWKEEGHNHTFPRKL